MKLDKEQVQRIDDFLKGLGFEYVDIRLEMLDHISTTIENEINDLESFFEDKKLNSDYLRYLLSKKNFYKEIYNKQVKSLFWSNVKNIFKDLYRQLFITNNFVFLKSNF